MSQMIYLDNAATTRMAPEVKKAMEPYLDDLYGNPSSVYALAQKSRKAVAAARAQAAHVIGASAAEIYFTSGGSEADNWALQAAADAFAGKGNHIITSVIEHPAVLRTLEYLEKTRGIRVTYLDVDQEGRVDPAAVENAITEDTILVSVMTANNEVGTIEPVREIGEAAHRHGVWFHTDAVQAFGHIPLDVKEMNIDLLSASGHKFNGPKGTGILYIRKGITLPALIHGGGQERNRRAGTENVPGIVGIGAAAALAEEHMEEHYKYVRDLRNYMEKRILREISGTRINGSRDSRLPGHLNVSFEDAAGESLLILLDMEEIAASAGSACSSGSIDPSHVLTAMDIPRERAYCTLRFTLSYGNTKEEIDRTVDVLKESVHRLRKMRMEG